MTDFQASRESVPIEGIDQLVEEFHLAGKPREAWRIGTEYEKLAVDPTTGKALPFSGRHGVEAVLERLADRYGWEPKQEDGRTIALARGNTSITLEPGAQIELAGEACETLHCTRAEMATHLEELVAVGEELGVAFLGLGIQPSSRLDEIELVPKQRYQIMAPYMERVGSLGLRMMKQTATVQANIDYRDERDAMHKIAAGMRLVPLVSAMFGNSSVLEDELSGRVSFRGHVWSDTDDDRSGLLPLAFDASAGFDSYVQWALDVPMYFILRDGRYRQEVTGLPFRRYLEQGAGAERATMDDWHLHLTTLFPEVRLKRFIEFRSADSQPPELILAFPALIKGIFYEPDCLEALWDIGKSWGLEECRELYDDATRHGLRARARRIALHELAKEVSQIAAEGLKRQACSTEDGRDERIYLEPLLEYVEARRSPGDVIAERWAGEWGGSVEKLVRDVALSRSLHHLNFQAA